MENVIKALDSYIAELLIDKEQAEASLSLSRITVTNLEQKNAELEKDLAAKKDESDTFYRLYRSLADKYEPDKPDYSNNEEEPF